MRIALFCVGNKRMLDDGIGPAVYEELVSGYGFSAGDAGGSSTPLTCARSGWNDGAAGDASVDLFDVGCMSLDHVGCVRDYDLVITVDAVDGTGEPAGTVFRFAPEDMARRAAGSQSLHDLKLSDLFDAAALLGYDAEGLCFGMQVENPSPAEFTVGLTPAVFAKLPDLVDAVLAELVRRGVRVVEKATGRAVGPGFHHVGPAIR